MKANTDIFTVVSFLNYEYEIFIADFKQIYPVPCGLVIAAYTKGEALEIAKRTVTHTEIKGIAEIEITEPKVIFYEDGNY